MNSRHSAFSTFTSGVICVVTVASKGSRSTPCRIDAACDYKSDSTRTIIFFSMAQQPLVVQDLPFIEASRSHSVGLLWTRGQPVAKTYTLQHRTLSKDRHECPRRDSNPQSQQGSGLRPTL